MTASPPSTFSDGAIGIEFGEVCSMGFITPCVVSCGSRPMQLRFTNTTFSKDELNNPTNNEAANGQPLPQLKGSGNLHRISCNTLRNFSEEARLDVSAVASLLRKCGNAKALSEGKRIHDNIIRSGYGEDRFLCNLLIQMYGNCGAITEARYVFDNLYSRNSFSWNIMLGIYARHGRVKQALQLFQGMPEPNVVSWNALISAHCQQGQLKQAQGLFDRMPVRDKVSWNSIIFAYAQRGQLKEALHLFNQMPDKDVMSWTAMVSAYSQQGMLAEALHFFQKMPHKDVVSWNTIISACAQQGQLKEALHLFQHMPKRNVVTWTIMISAYAQQGRLNDAIQFFQKMPKRNVSSWNAMITVFSNEGQLQRALQLFQDMPERNIISWNSMMSAYNQHGQLEDAMQIFCQMPQRNVVSWTAMITACVQEHQLEMAYRLFLEMPMRNVVTWNVMISGYAQHRKLKEALQLFAEMRLEMMEPNTSTFLGIIDGCVVCSTLDHGKQIDMLTLDYGFGSDTMIQSALINMYAKCGSLNDARKVFSRMSKWDAISCSGIIAANALYGCGEEALEIFQQMQIEGVSPNAITFCSILSACSHSGLVNHGYNVFLSAAVDHGITFSIEHYTCILDVLGRTKALEESAALIENMPFVPDFASWMSLLGSCRIHLDVKHAKFAAGHAIALNPAVAAPYVLLANIYFALGHWDDALKLRQLMEKQDLNPYFDLVGNSE